MGKDKDKAYYTRVSHALSPKGSASYPFSKTPRCTSMAEETEDSAKPLIK